MNKPNWIIGLIILMIPALFVMKYTSVPYEFHKNQTAELKLAFQHIGQRVKEYDEIAALRERAKQYRKQLKKDREIRMSLKSRATVTRERFPIQIELYLDGKKIHEKEYPPTGRKRDAMSVIYDVFEVSPGRHEVKVVMKDSKKEGAVPYVFKDEVEFDAREVKVITYDRVHKKLYWSDKLIPLHLREENLKEG